MVGWLVGWSVGWLVGQLVGWLGVSLDSADMVIFDIWQQVMVCDGCSNVEHSFFLS